MLVSIIVPVYNCEKFLQRCLESIINQTYKDIEIILVNDGSTDSSGNICDKYAKEDKRIIVSHKKNNGVSSARNVGLKIATGMYIGFVDSDDYIDQKMIEKLVKNAIDNNADISMCGCLKETEEGEMINQRTPKGKSILNCQEALNNIHDSNKYHGYAGNKLYSRHIIYGKELLLFDEGVHVCEDLLFSCQAFMRSSKLVFDSSQLYHYIFHSDNSTSKFNNKKLTAITAYKKIFKLLKGNEEVVVKIEEFKNSYNKLIISLMVQNMNTKDDEYSKRFQFLKKEIRKSSIIELSSLVLKICTILAKGSPRLMVFILKIRRKLIRNVSFD